VIGTVNMLGMCVCSFHYVTWMDRQMEGQRDGWTGNIKTAKYHDVVLVLAYFMMLCDKKQCNVNSAAINALENQIGAVDDLIIVQSSRL
jgi:hypothetical protein